MNRERATPFTLAELERRRAALRRARPGWNDPVRFVWRYRDPRDREIAALVASALAYGRLASILRSVERALAPLGPAPAAYLADPARRARLGPRYRGFVHRWTRGRELVAALRAAGELQAGAGSLAAVFAQGLAPTAGRAELADDLPVLRGLAHLAERLHERAPVLAGSGLLPRPGNGSACKRWNLFLRWMVRHDEVDPGGWTVLRPADLLVPLDVHMFRIAREHRMTQRRQPDLKAVLEVTAAFAALCPEDPIRYDFALTQERMAGKR